VYDAPDLRGTRPCRRFRARGSCNKGDACMFSHERQERPRKVAAPDSRLQQMASNQMISATHLQEAQQSKSLEAHYCLENVAEEQASAFEPQQGKAVSGDVWGDQSDHSWSRQSTSDSLRPFSSFSFTSAKQDSSEKDLDWASPRTPSQTIPSWAEDSGDTTPATLSLPSRYKSTGEPVQSKILQSKIDGYGEDTWSCGVTSYSGDGRGSIALSSLSTRKSWADMVEDDSDDEGPWHE